MWSVCTVTSAMREGVLCGYVGYYVIHEEV